MIELHNDALLISFPEVHPRAKCSVEFQRTLRIPDDNQDYPLPAGLGSFPLLPVDDYEVPTDWKRHGGVFFPMYQSEAMWISLRSHAGRYPFAVKIAAGKINAITGKAWNQELSTAPQDYVVIPDQPWLDGFSVAKDTVRQFVAMPLGEGITAEEQLTGEAEWGGLQLIFYPMKALEYEKRFGDHGRLRSPYLAEPEGVYLCSMEMDMGLAPGGRIRQEIAEDSYGPDVWDTSVSSRCFVHLLNSGMYQSVTGQTPPTRPVTAKQYADAGIPWFEYYLDGASTDGSGILAGLDGVAAALQKKGKKLPDNKPISISKTIKLGHHPRLVKDGQF